MKHIIILMVLALGLASCSKDSPLSENSKELAASSQQKWVLIKMTGSFGLNTTTGSDMQWQEHYIFNGDSTFTKNRVQDTTNKTAFGTYKLITESGQEYVELTFISGKELVGSCYGEGKERLWKTSVNRMKGTWNICDGPSLEYARPTDF